MFRVRNGRCTSENLHSGNNVGGVHSFFVNTKKERNQERKVVHSSFLHRKEERTKKKRCRLHFLSGSGGVFPEQNELASQARLQTAFCSFRKRITTSFSLKK